MLLMKANFRLVFAYADAQQDKGATRRMTSMRSFFSDHIMMHFRKSHKIINDAQLKILTISTMAKVTKLTHQHSHDHQSDGELLMSLHTSQVRLLPSRGAS